MDRFDEDLHRALRERQPPQDFSARVLVRLRKSSRRSVSWFSRFAIVGVVVCVLLIVVVQYNQRQQEIVRAERAKEQVLEALRITRDKLQPVQDRLRGSSEH